MDFLFGNRFCFVFAAIFFRLKSLEPKEVGGKKEKLVTNDSLVLFHFLPPSLVPSHLQKFIIKYNSEKVLIY